MSIMKWIQRITKRRNKGYTEGERVMKLVIQRCQEASVSVNGKTVGIARVFGCSVPTANRIKKSGIIDKAITQIGRKIVVDADLALSLAKESGGIHIKE